LGPLTGYEAYWGILLWCELCVRQSTVMKDKPEALQRRADHQECRKRDRSRVLQKPWCARVDSIICALVDCVVVAVATVVSFF
jgi:hypothetical protein